LSRWYQITIKQKACTLGERLHSFSATNGKQHERINVAPSS
jgi:hypothetical protein